MADEVSDIKPSDYQVVCDGVVIAITDLTRDQLIRELVKAINCLEDLDELLFMLNKNSNQRIGDWRYNRKTTRKTT